MTRDEDGSLTASDRRGSDWLGFSLGVGLAFVPLVGIPTRFIFTDLPVSVSYGGALLLGMLLGGLLRRR